MPPSATELETWWLGRGRDALTKLVEASALAASPHECGFAQAVQRRLRAFDNNNELDADLRASMSELAASKAFPHDFNPWKKMHEAMRSIFLPSDESGINYDGALVGLEYLDAMEAHRQRVVAATRLAMATGCPDEYHRQLIEELDRHTTLRYSHFHMGLRASILMLDLAAPKSSHRIKSPLELMARLNALFPA